MRGLLRTEVVTVAANGLLSAVEDALEFQKRIVERTTHQDPPTEMGPQVTPRGPAKLPVLTPRSPNSPSVVLLRSLAFWMLLQHWRLWFKLLHEELPPAEVGAATAARAQAEVTTRASLENIARVKSERG